MSISRSWIILIDTQDDSSIAYCHPHVVKQEERREREGGSFWRTHDNFGLFRVRDRLQQRSTSIIVDVIYPREKFLLLCWRIAINTFTAYFLRNLGVQESITHILMYIVGINRAKRAALLLHVGSQFLYLDNQWWAHLRQCYTALLDEKVRNVVTGMANNEPFVGLFVRQSKTESSRRNSLSRYISCNLLLEII